MPDPRRHEGPQLSSAAQPISNLAGQAVLWASVLLGAAACSDDGGLAEGETGDATGSETGSETGTDDGELPNLPELLSDPELVFHPNQPMIVDVIVELDRTGVVEIEHDDDPGVRVASLLVEDDGRRHHLRVRGLAPATEHALTLSLGDPADPSMTTQLPLGITTQTQLPGFRPSFDVELSDAAALDPAYRLFDYAYTPLWDPAGLFVIDTQGVTRWHYEGGSPAFIGPTAIWAGIELLDDGTILAVRDGAITVIDELGEQRLRYLSFDYGLSAFHHDVHLLGNGNFLALCNSFADVDYSSLNIGLGITHVAGDLLVEIDPAGNIVWMWDAFDHLDPLRLRSAPDEGLEYLDPESGEFGYDWTHGNGMIHSVVDDVILLSMRHQDWLVAIDHQSGEVVWRLGAEGDFELLSGTWFFHQHSPQWQPDGSLMLYDNANGNPDVELINSESRAVRYELDFDAMTATQVWDSLAGESYLSSVAGDADQTPAGNVLMLDSALQPDAAQFDIGKNFSRLTELSYDQAAPSPIWRLTTKIGSFVYRATAIDRLPGETN